VRRGKGCAPKTASRVTLAQAHPGSLSLPDPSKSLMIEVAEYREIAECSDYSPPIGDRTLVERDIQRDFIP
jgi:hypothetical protein